MMDFRGVMATFFLRSHFFWSTLYNIYSTVSTTSTISTIYNIYLIYQPTAYLAIVIGSLAAAAVSVVVVQLTVWRTHGDTAPPPG